MTQDIKDVLKLAFEALDNLLYWDNGKPEYDEAREAITAIKEALRENAMREVQRLGQEIEQEPVGEMRLSEIIDGLVVPVVTADLPTSTKLYTAPPQQEPVAKYSDIVDVDGGVMITITSPPQRTWVGLTGDDWKQITRKANYHWEMTTGEYAERIGELTEAKLKELNT